jgi:hypothetical protein
MFLIKERQASASMAGVVYDRIFVLSQWHTGINIVRAILIDIIILS